MKYEQKKWNFPVGSKKYRDNYDKIFKSKQPKKSDDKDSNKDKSPNADQA